MVERSNKVTIEFSEESKRLMKKLIESVNNIKPPDMSGINRAMAEFQKIKLPTMPMDALLAETEESAKNFDPGGSTVIAPECFISNSGNVISYKSENFYKFCAHPIRVIAGETHTTCVLPLDHDGLFHVDFDGTNKEV